MFGEEDIIKSHRPRLDLLGNFLLLAFAIILGRLWYLQIYKGDLFFRYSLENGLRKETVKAPRGMIFSRNNQVLVYNVPRFDAVIIPQYLSKEEQTIGKLARVLNVSTSAISEELRRAKGQARYLPVTIKKNINRKEVAIIETENFKLPGVIVRPFIGREYLDKEVGAHVFGHLSEISANQLPKYRKRDSFDYKLGDFIGQSGIEEQFDLFLRGRDGHQFMEVDAWGRMKRIIAEGAIFQGIENRKADPGFNLRLTLDRDLQKTAYEALESKVGSVVAIDVKSGEVLVMVGRPSFDPTQFSHGISEAYWSSLRDNPHRPLRARSIQEHYAPGSTFKAISAIAGLEEGIIDEKTEVHCPGHFRLGRRKVNCWRRYGHGKVNVVDALRESCDVFFYKLASKLDIDRLAHYARLFGFGRRTGIALPNEKTGLVPTREWKLKQNGVEWQLGETLYCAIGQSYVLSTPLQLANAYAAIADGKFISRPSIVREIFGPDGEVKKKMVKEEVVELDISAKTLQLVRQGLFEVVNSETGTAKWYAGRGLEMAGKTGTSQVVSSSEEELWRPCMEKKYEFRHHALFSAFAPFRDPSIAVAVLVEHGCSGSSAAAPVARDLIAAYMKKYRPELSLQIMEEERKAYQLKLQKKREKEKEEAALSSKLESVSE